jgi:integrase
MRDSSRTPKAYTQKRDGKWWARVVYFDSEGKRREKRRVAEAMTKSGKMTSTQRLAKSEAAKLLAEAVATDGKALEHESTTFGDLADFYAKNFLCDIEYDNDGDKLGRGVRPKSRDTAMRRLEVLRERFGAQLLQSIDVDDIYRFKVERYRQPTAERNCWKCKGTGEKRKPGRRPSGVTLPPCEACGGKRTVGGGQRSWATVHRELTLLCAMLNVAEARGWIVRNPFTRGGRRGADREKLIDPNKERSRDRILSFAEEGRIFDAIDTETIEGQRLRLVVVMALDSGARLGELCHLDWPDVDLVAGHINLRKVTTKTLTARRVPLTPRMRDELLAWQARFQAPARECVLCRDTHAHILGNSENIGRAWRRARAAAGVPDVRLHDLRHSFATRATHGGMPGILVARILGHKAPLGTDDDAQLAMTTRYVGTAASTTALAVAAIEAARVAEAAETVN